MVHSPCEASVSNSMITALIFVDDAVVVSESEVLGAGFQGIGT